MTSQNVLSYNSNFIVDHSATFCQTDSGGQSFQPILTSSLKVVLRLTSLPHNTSYTVKPRSLMHHCQQIDIYPRFKISRILTLSSIWLNINKHELKSSEIFNTRTADIFSNGVNCSVLSKIIVQNIYMSLNKI